MPEKTKNKKKSNNKDRVVWCDRSIFESTVYYAICRSEKAYIRELKRLRVPEKSWDDWIDYGSNATTHTLVNESGMTCCIVCIDPKAKASPSERIGLLIHEGVHVWQNIRKDIGEDCPSVEFEAYAIQGICQRLIEAYK